MEINAENRWQRQNMELVILNEVAQALNRSVDLPQILETVLAKVANLLDLQTGWVWLLTEGTGEHYLASAQALPPALADDPAGMAGDCYCLRTFREGDLDGAANINVVTCSRLQGLISGTDGLLYHASIPLYAHGKQLGVLNVASSDWRKLSKDDLRLLYTVGDMLGIAIERARLFSRSANVGALEERNRLAREIHDTLAQGLTAVTLHLQSADAHIEAGADVATVQTAVQKALSLTRANLEEARRSVMDLRAVSLEGRSLIQALGALVNLMSENGDCRIDFEVVGGGRPLSPRIEAGVYRVAQEALTNVQRHAEATWVTLQLVFSPDNLQLDIFDDGRGFEPETLDQSRFGLVGMNERVRLLNGRLQIESSPGAGTHLIISVPL